MTSMQLNDTLIKKNKLLQFVQLGKQLMIIYWKILEMNKNRLVLFYFKKYAFRL